MMQTYVVIITPFLGVMIFVGVLKWVELGEWIAERLV